MANDNLISLLLKVRLKNLDTKIKDLEEAISQDLKKQDVLSEKSIQNLKESLVALKGMRKTVQKQIELEEGK